MIFFFGGGVENVGLCCKGLDLKWILSDCDVGICSFAWAWDLVLEACFLVNGVCSFGFSELIWLLSGVWVDATFVWLLIKSERMNHLWVWGDWTNALFGWWENFGRIQLNFSFFGLCFMTLLNLKILSCQLKGGFCFLGSRLM